MSYVVKRRGIYWPNAFLKKISIVNDEKIYGKADKDPLNFWAKLAEEGIYWNKKWSRIYEERLPFFKWFINAELNISYNALDRNLDRKNPALIWVPEPIDESAVKISYKELLLKVNKFANVLKKFGIKKGDVVCIYLPLIPEVIVAMLACARIGAIHSVVFSAFSAQALKARIDDGKAKILISSDGYFRRGIKEDLISKAREGVDGSKIEKVVLVNRFKSNFKLRKNEFLWDELMKKASEDCEPESLKSDDTLFILYTSGTTGKPKGIVHDTGGYAVGAYYTSKWNFNLHENDVMWCTADVGWITGHTYMCYGPLLNGATSLMYEGSPDYPDQGKFWKIINEHKVNAFYTAPTALRMFRLWGDKWIPKKMESLKILGSVGEPIDKETWHWYFDKIGKKKLPIIDTWWQTETGTNMINAIPGIGPFIPGVAGKSFPGTRHGVIDDEGKMLKNGKGFLVQLSPFAPSMLHGVWGDDEKYKEKYWKFKDKDVNFYVTGDSAFINKDGSIRILGRSDDVIKVAGHRLSTAEMEDVVHNCAFVGDVAVVSRPDEIKGEAIVIFARLKDSTKEDEKIKEEIVKALEKGIGPIARPKEIYFVDDLPKTRSGKIMRRILKSLLRDEPLGELSTIVNPDCIDKIRNVLGVKPAT